MHVAPGQERIATYSPAEVAAAMLETVAFWRTRAGCLNRLERLDFEEQFRVTTDPADRIRLCAKWIAFYKPIAKRREDRQRRKAARSRQ